MGYGDLALGYGVTRRPRVRTYHVVLYLAMRGYEVLSYGVLGYEVTKYDRHSNRNPH